MARGFLPVDTSGISQGISDAASGLGGWLSNAFTTPDSVVQSRQQHFDTWRGGPEVRTPFLWESDDPAYLDQRARGLGYINAADRELANDLVQHKAKNILGWSSEPHDPVLSDRIQEGRHILGADVIRPQKQIDEDYEAAVHAAALTHPRKTIGWLKGARDFVDVDSAIDQAQEAWSDNRIMELSQGGRVSIPELVRQGIGQYPASVVAGVDLNEDPSSPLSRLWDRAIDKGSDLIDWFTPSLPDLSGVNLPVEEPTGSLFDDPSISNENTLMMNSLIPIGTGSGTVIVEDTPDGTIVTDMEPTYSERILDPSTWLRDDHIDRTPGLNRLDTDSGIESILPDLNAAFNYALDLRPETTAEEFDDFVTSQILGVDMPEIVSSLPSGPEEMTEVFTEEDKAAEDERKRIAEIAAQAERDQFELERKAERLAWEARREQERAEEDARKKREEAARAQDRQDKARLAREADERERQARERQRELEDERRQAVEAARLNELARAAEQQNLANQRRQREEQARKQAEFDRQHQRFMDQLIANNRNRGSYRGMQPGLAGPR